MKKTVICGLLGLALTLSARAQDLKDTPAIQNVIKNMKSLSGRQLSNAAAASGPLAYGLDPIKKVDVGPGRKIMLTALTSTCQNVGLDLPFVVDAKPRVVVGVLAVWGKGYACGGLAQPAQFVVDNPARNSTLVESAGGSSNYKLAEVRGAVPSLALTPTPDIELTVYIRANEEVAGPFALDVSKQNGGKPTIIVGAIVLDKPIPPGYAVSQLMRAVRLRVSSPISAPNLDIEIAGR